MFQSEIIQDSVNCKGSRLTTFVLEFPRIVLAEFNTHRALSRNSASSRAIPLSLMLKKASRSEGFRPIAFQKTHRGMQGSEVMAGQDEIQAMIRWEQARGNAMEQATKLGDLGVTKQICNRLLEPFVFHKVIATGDDKGWKNFFALRAHEAAEIHIQKIANMMLDDYNSSKPKELKKNEWHIPFGDMMDCARLAEVQGYLEENKSSQYLQSIKIKIATARCARVSYDNFEGKDDYLKDLDLHDALGRAGHWSPFEHCAMAYLSDKSLCSNFGPSWFQYRKGFRGECKNDSRVKFNSSPYM